MEVHVRNVPQGSAENALRKFLKPHFEKLSIQYVRCEKFKNNRHASLTFLYITDAQKFLAQFGQSESNQSRRQPRFTAASVTLKFLGQPIYCSKSTRDANHFQLRSLAKKEKDNQAKVTVHTAGGRDNVPASLPVGFRCASISCGIWNYASSELVFERHWTREFAGKVIFGEHSMMMISETGYRIDFRYFGTLNITTEDGQAPALTFTMCEAPYCFQKISNPLAELIVQLNISLQTHQRRLRKGVQERYRLPYLDEDHKQVIGSCLVYHIALKEDLVGESNGNNIGNRMQSLRRVPLMPTMVHQQVNIRRPKETFAECFQALQKTLSTQSRSKDGLPFVLLFQIQKLAQNGYLPPQIVMQLLPTIKEMLNRSPLQICVKALRKLFLEIPYPGPETESSELEFKTLIDLLSDNEARCKREATELNDATVSGNVAIIHRVKVTPSGIYLYGPEPESNNRVLRKYSNCHEYFLRVQFCEEDGNPVRFNPRISNEKIFHERFKKVLDEGIMIAGRKYDFLGFSHSSLRSQSCWFIAPFLHEGRLLWDRIIIQELGDFSIIRSPAKCAARIGQAFSDTRIAITVNPEIVQNVLDVDVNGRVFSDGVGTMSRSVMTKIWDRLPKKHLVKPTLFQIRYKGAKGMISLDPRLQGEALFLRPSMIKFEGSTSADIEICDAPYKPLPMYLNRQFIKILEDMGVDDKFFLDLQAKQIKDLRMIMESSINASSFLERQSIGGAVQLPWLIAELTSLDLDFRQDAFLRDIMELAFLFEVRLLKHKTRIFVENGMHLHGLMDETGFLQEGQIYCSFIVNGVPKILVGKDLIISRAPALHPGDVQLAEGIMPPRNSPLLELSNCICFSSKGSRDLPSKLSGDDLDGDRYYIMWDKRARPKKTFEPADYPRQGPIDIGRPVERMDMTHFFIQFMETDQLGRIAVSHRVLADQSPVGTLDPDCIILASMHSTAVDFSKTGIPVDMERMPRINRCRPDFEAPGPHVRIEKNGGITFEEPGDEDPDEKDDQDDGFTTYRYYESNKILGKLYRAIDERKLFLNMKGSPLSHGITNRSTVIDVAWGFVQNRFPKTEWKHHLEWAGYIRDMYEEKLLNIMMEDGDHPSRPLTELEAFIRNILGRTGAQNKQQRERSISLKERFNNEATFIVNCIVKDDNVWSEEALERSMACLAVSLEDRRPYKRQGRLVSFKYLAAAVCLKEVSKYPVF